VSTLATFGDPVVGNEAGWALTFHRERAGEIVHDPVLAIGIQDYYADIQATLASDVEGGTYTFTVEGMTLEDHAKISQSSSDRPTVVQLYLYWRDTASSPVGYLANLAGLTDLLGPSTYAALQPALVAVLAVTSVSRALGERNYETTIVGRERAYERLYSRRLTAAVKKETFSAAAAEVGTRAGVTVEPVGFDSDGTLPPARGAPPGAEAVPEAVTKDPGISCLQALTELATSVEYALGLHGRGMTLVRHGEVVFGPRPIPEPGVQPAVLTLHGGLIEVTAVGGATTDPNFDPAENGGAVPEQRQFKLLLKGRPDLKPGDLVRFDLPPDELPSSTAAQIGANLLAAVNPVAGETLAHPATLYVSSVDHRLGRTSGFSTTLTGVVVDENDPWDTHSDGGSQPHQADTGDNGNAANPAVDAASAIRRLAHSAVDSARLPEIGEVREGHAETGADSVSQTVDVFRGLEPSDGKPNQARRLAVRRKNPARVEGVATATSFAWGKCGLVVPRYPGTRVVLLHRNGRADDPVDVGAVWESGRGPDSQPGDWWLTLPVAYSGDKRAVADDQTAGEHTGKVSNDLIAADGKRVIEVAGLTVSVGPASLKDAGTRPQPPGDDAVVTIENADQGARLTIDKDGSVTIHAAKDIVLAAPSGDIKLEAVNVDVKVSAQMDVH
jgi:hypothetical protein